MKKVSAMLMAGAMTLSILMTGCGGSQASSSSQSMAASSQPAASESQASTGGSGEMKKIGVLQFLAHPALDAAYQGFVDGLKEAGYEDGKNITIDFQNAQGEQSNCPTIASKLVNDKNDLILAIATPAAQAVANATSDIPILVTAVTDPADAKLVQSNEKPGTNVTGTSDLTPVKEQIGLLKELVPDAKKIGFLYTSSEANSTFQINMAREAAQAIGLETQDFTISSTNELQSVVTSMVGKVDAIYTPTDNLVANAMPTVAAIAIENKIPLIVGETGMVTNGGLASYSIDYYLLGKMTAEQAVLILEGKEKPQDMPIRYQTEFVLDINKETAEKIGITIPESLLK